jgi:hypothetical protein
MSFRRARRSALVSGALGLALFVPLAADAQSSLDDAIRQFGPTQVRGYVQPLADALVANLSSGYFYTGAPRSSLGFSFEVVAMGTAISDKMRTYTARTPEGFDPETFTAPTIFGGKGPTVQHATIPGLSYRASDGVLNSDYFPTALPQLRISGLLNSEVVVRYVDSDWLGSIYPKEDLPQLTMFGIGVRHGLNRYFGDLPVDLAVSASYNSMTMGDDIDVKGTTFGANVGKGFGVLSVMGGVESSGGTMDLAYTSESAEDPGPATVDLTAKRQLRFTAGATLDFKFLKIFGTAGFGEFTTYAGGLRFGL